MFNALNRGAITLATNGVATLEDIDLAWTTGTKMPRGHRGTVRLAGCDHAKAC